MVKRDTTSWALPVIKLQFISSWMICLIFFWHLLSRSYVDFFHVSCRETPCISVYFYTRALSWAVRPCLISLYDACFELTRYLLVVRTAMGIIYVTYLRDRTISLSIPSFLRSLALVFCLSLFNRTIVWVTTIFLFLRYEYYKYLSTVCALLQLFGFCLSHAHVRALVRFTCVLYFADRSWSKS